jgi:hypothetical protein
MLLFMRAFVGAFEGLMLLWSGCFCLLCLRRGFELRLLVSYAMFQGPGRVSGGRHTWSEMPLVGSKYASSSVAFPAEDVSSLIVDFEGPELASTPRNLRHFTILEQTDSFHPMLG